MRVRMEQARGEQRKRRQQPPAARGQRLARRAAHGEDERAEAGDVRQGANVDAVRLHSRNEQQRTPQELNRGEQLDPSPPILC